MRETKIHHVVYFLFLIVFLVGIHAFLDFIWAPPPGMNLAKSDFSSTTSVDFADSDDLSPNPLSEEPRKAAPGSDSLTDLLSLCSFPGEWVVEVYRLQKVAPDHEVFIPIPGAWVCVIDLDGAGTKVNARDWLSSHWITRHWFDLTGIAQVGTRLLMLNELPPGLGNCYLSNADGIVRIPVPLSSRDLLLLGWTGEERGCLMPRLSNSPNPPFRLELRSDSIVRIQVVDHQGHPQSCVPICLTPYQDGLSMPVLNTSGSNGILEVHCIQDFFGVLDQSMGKEPQLFVHLAVPLAGPVGTSIERGSLPMDPLRLSLPPTGSVRIELPTMDMEEGEWLLAMLDLAKGATWDVHSSTCIEAPGISSSRVRAKGGPVLFKHVGLGLTLEARVIRYSPSGLCQGSPLSESFKGPVAPGEVVVHRIYDLPAIPRLLGRAVDGWREPLPRRRLVVSLDGDRPFGATPNCTTDDAGRFRRPLRPSSPKKDPREEDRRRLRVTGPAEGPDPPLEGFLLLPLGMPDSGYDIGDLCLLPVPLVASGTVVDEQCRPVPGAIVEAKGLLPALNDTFPATCSARTDPEGRFWLHSSRVREGILIYALSEGFVPDWIRTVAGTRKIRFILRRGSGLDGSVLLPKNMDPRLFCPILGRPGAPEEMGLEFSFNAYGRFRLANLAPGLRSLSIHLSNPEGPVLHRVEEILLEAGRVNHDLRLQGIDLRPLLQVVKLEVVDTFGVPVPGVEATATGKEGKFQGTMESGEGSSSFLLPHGEYEVRIDAPKFRPTVINIPPERQRVILKKGLAVILRIEPPLNYLKENTSVQLVLEGETPGSRLGINYPGGEARFDLPGPGRYRVSVQITIWPSGGWNSQTASVIDPLWIDVRDVPGEQVFLLRLDQALRANDGETTCFSGFRVEGE